MTPKGLWGALAVFALIIATWLRPDDSRLIGRNVLYFLPSIFILLASWGMVARHFGVHNLFRDDAQVFGKPGWWDIVALFASPALWSGAGFAALFGYAWIITYSGWSIPDCSAEQGDICRRLLFGGDPQATPLVPLLCAALVFWVASVDALLCHLADLNRRGLWSIVREAVRVILGLALGGLFSLLTYAWAAGIKWPLAGAMQAAVDFMWTWLGRIDFIWMKGVLQSFHWKVIAFLVLLGVLTALLRYMRLLLDKYVRPRGDGLARPASILVNMVAALVGVATGVIILAALYDLAMSVEGRPEPSGLWLVTWVYSVPVVVTFVARTSLPCVSIGALGISLMALGLVGPLIAESLVKAIMELPLSASTDERPVAIVLAVGATLFYLIVTNGWPWRYRIPGFSYAIKVNPHVSGSVQPSTPTSPERAKRAKPESALSQWEDQKIVILCVSGGAYRATFWTSLVIDHLLKDQKRFPAFAKSVPLVTGASGGMVAGAYFAAMRASNNGNPVTDQIEADTLEQMRKEGRLFPISRDSLSAVAHQLAQWDLRDLLLIGCPHMDRGQVLERQWTTLDLSFQDFAGRADAGQVPSLIVSPMLVESGAPALFSNLDLSEIRDQAEEPDKTSVDIFKAFPDAYGAVTLATAVRLNGTFPYISPAISLPAKSDRRPVDAGYYDNFGVDLATDYLDAKEVFKVVTDHCKGVAVVQIRAFPSDQPTPKTGLVSRSLQFLTSPLQGVSSARRSSQMFRNDQQLASVKRRYDEEIRSRIDKLISEERDETKKAMLAREKSKDFFRIFTFEANADISMSWYTRNDEMDALRRLLRPLTARDFVDFSNGKVAPEGDAEVKVTEEDAKAKVTEEDAKAKVYAAFGGKEENYVASLQARKLKARIGQSLIHRARIASELERLSSFLAP